MKKELKMKKVIFLVAALLTVFSGIAAVTAYEGHAVDVKAHVENALMVETYEVNFGTVFPEADLETQFRVGLSESFVKQERYSTVKYNMYWEPKPIEQGYTDLDKDGYFEAIWPSIAVQNDGVDFPIKDYKDMGNGIMYIGKATLSDTAEDACDTIHFILTPPVFEGYYNAATDALIGMPVPAILEEGEFYVTEETAVCGFKANVPHADLGSNFKIQVTGIVVDLGATGG
jgi:hypothetical protein